MALLPVSEALQRILSGVKPLRVESVPLDHALGRVLAKSVFAKRDQPPFPASAMDGYAVRFDDISTLPATLKIIGVSAAGRGFRKAMKQGECVRILTGAPVPASADTVVIQENTSRGGDILTVLHATTKGRNIRRAGLDFSRGDELLAAPCVLRPRDLGLAAAGNAPVLKLYRKPRVALFTTGDELVLPGMKPRADQIVSSNSTAIAAMVQAMGAEVINLGIVPDTLKATKAAVRKGMAADVLLTTGGASVGDHDYVQEAFKTCGIQIGFWKIALRPGKPFMYGRKSKLHVMGLPGNPVSALITARIFLATLLKSLQGLPHETQTVLAKLGADMPENDDRQDYVRATLVANADGTQTATPFSLQDSSMQRTLQLSQCLILRAPFAPPAKLGELVSVMILDF